MSAPRRVSVLLVTDARTARETRSAIEPLARTLDRTRFQPWLVCEPVVALDAWADERRREGTAVDRVAPLRNRLDLGRAVAWFRFLRRHRGALVHVVHGVRGSARYVVPIAHLAGVRAVVVTEEVSRSARSIGQRWLKKWELLRADVCVAARPEVADSMSDALGVAHELFDVVAPGVSPPPPLPAPERRRERARLGVPQTGLLWAAIGVGPAEIGALHGAWSELASPRPVLAVVAADGRGREPLRLPEWRVVEEPDEETLLAACDAAIVPPSGRAVPVALFQAMAAGLPVVTWPSEPEWLDSEGLGAVRSLASMEPGAIAAGVRSLSADPSAARALGARARAWADRAASAQPLVDRYEELYRRALRVAEPGERSPRAEHAA